MIKLDAKITVSKEDYLDYVNELMVLVNFLKDELMTLNLTDDKSAAIIWNDKYITALDQLACLNDDYQSLSDELDEVRSVSKKYERLYLGMCEAYDKLRDGVNTDDLIGRISYLREVIEKAENERDDALGLNLTSDKNAADKLKKYRATNQLLKEENDGLRDELNYVYDNGTEDDNTTIGKQDTIIKDLVATIENYEQGIKRVRGERDYFESELDALRDEYEGLEHDYIVLAERNQLLDQLLNNQCDDDEEVVRKLEREIASLKDTLDAINRCCEDALLEVKHPMSVTETFMDVDGFNEGIKALKDLLDQQGGA